MSCAIRRESASFTRTFQRTCVRLLLAAALASATLPAGEVAVAVAANFREAAAEIGEEFEDQTGHTPVFSYGSSGQLFAQIVQGAPFDIFVSADTHRVSEAVQAGEAVSDTRFTYAIGRIALFSLDPSLTIGPQVLRNARFGRLAIAQPRTAPYGKAAVEAMEALGVLETLASRIVSGQSVAQAYQFVHSGNADLGFVSLAQVRTSTIGEYWLVPERLHLPIRQDAVLLKRGARSEAAREFLSFLGGSDAATILVQYGYGLPQ